ncbi:MAG: leucine-rich repeat domain-containing protein [Promethearchaeia archaeon]
MYLNLPDNLNLRKRYCYLCGDQMDFGEFYARNHTLSALRIMKLWENKNLEFFCCACYDSIQEQKNLSAPKHALDIEEREALKIIERRYKVFIPLVKSLDFQVGFIMDEGKVSGLSLFRCHISEIPNILPKFSSLKKLNLAWNDLTKLDKSICSLYNLRILNVSGNKIKEISKDIANLQHLREFNLSYNNLTALPFTIGALYRLRHLNLIQNEISETPHILQFLRRIGLKILS